MKDIYMRNIDIDIDIQIAHFFNHTAVPVAGVKASCSHGLDFEWCSVDLSSSYAKGLIESIVECWHVM